MPGPLYLKNPRSNNTLPEADWLMTCVAADGTIAETPGDSNVRPYMANYAAMGLARTYEITGNPKYITAVWNWLAWYRDHMNATTGYINDYTGPSGARVDSGAADSTDAYAGTYLVALYLAYWADPAGATKLAEFTASIPLALTAIESTQQSDGLTYALPTYDVKYLEDNIETLVGVRSAYELARVLNDDALKTRCTATGDAMAKGIGYMWNHDAGTWDYAIHSNRVFAHNNWSDENSQRQQVWATAWGAIASNVEGRALLRAYSSALPDWSTKFDSYEVIPVWAYRNVKDHNTANAASINMQKNGWDHAHAYPWTCQISGIVLLGQAGFSPVMPSPDVIFPGGANLIPDPTFLTDTNSDGRADVITGTYGAPTTSLHDLVGPGNYQRIDTPDGNGWAVNWDDIPVQENTYVTFSVWQRVSRIGVGAGFNLKYELYNGSHGLVTYGYNPIPAEVGTDFTRWYVNAWIPPGTTHLRPILEVGSGAIDIAYPQVEESGSPSAPPYGIPAPAPSGF